MTMAACVDLFGNTTTRYNPHRDSSRLMVTSNIEFQIADQVVLGPQVVEFIQPSPIYCVAINGSPRDPWQIGKKNLQRMACTLRGGAVIFLAVSSLLLSSCADLKLPPDQPISNRHRNPGSGDCTFRRGSELGFWA